jgi:hypothetical protein
MPRYEGDASIEAEAPVKGGGTEPAKSPLDPSPAFLRPSLQGSWLNTQRALYIWAAIVAACVVWQPLLLGFYYDDWDLWVNGSAIGNPFSSTRLVFMNNTNPVRVGCLPGRFLASSLFGAHPLLWQGALLLINCVIAIAIVAACRVITQPRTPASRMLTVAAGLGWLVVPWNAGARYWPALLPNVAMLAVQGFLCALLIRGWAKNQARVVTAGSLYLWMCVSYEAFYLQWITITLIGLVLWMAKRVALRPIIVSAVVMVIAQGIAGWWNLYTKSKGYWTAMSVLPDWRQIVRRNLLNIVPSAVQSVSEISTEIVLCGAVVFAIGLVVYLRSLSRASDRPAAYISIVLAAICVLGGVVSVVVFSLAGRVVMGTGVESRSLMVFNFWLVIAGAIVTTFVFERLAGMPKAVFAIALTGFGLCLGVGQVLRASDWATAWSLQKKILAEVPVSDLKRTELDARIILLNKLEVNGAPIFAAEWDINNAIGWAYPFLKSRRFVVYNKWMGPMKWDGRQLSYVGQPPREVTTEVYLWRPYDISFWRPAGPFVINQDLTVEPAR